MKYLPKVVFVTGALVFTLGFAPLVWTFNNELPRRTLPRMSLTPLPFS